MKTLILVTSIRRSRCVKVYKNQSYHFQHVIALLECESMRVVVAALRTLYVFSRRSALLMNAKPDLRAQLAVSLVSIAEVSDVHVRSSKHCAVMGWSSVGC
jgi:hypothetical protein